MTTSNHLVRIARCLGGAGIVAILPACSALDGHRPVTLPVPPVMTVPAETENAVTVTPTVVLTAGQTRADEGAKSVPPATPPATLPKVPPAAEQGKPLPINLPTALTLSGASPLDIQIAEERLQAAAAVLDRANVLWLPNVALGVDYFRHDGQIQDVAGTVFTTSRSSLLLGAGPNLVVSVGEAMYAPLVARQVLEARQADVQAARNDSTFRVAEAYFNVQQARGEVAGSIDALRRAEELVRITQKLGEFAPSVEVNRARTEAARRRQAVESAYERWQVAAAELARILRLQPGTLVEPAEEPALMVELIRPEAAVDELIPVALTYRPELAADQALIQAALARAQQERARPLLPTIGVRGVASQVPGLAGGYFGGGLNDNMSNFGGRFSVDLQAVWEFQNLGLGNSALVREREAESRQALLQLVRTQDRVAAEVVQAHARLKRAANRVKSATDGVADAAETADKNLRGLVPGKRVGEQLVLIFRPQEAVAAVAALDQAYRDYYAAVADHNRAQYQLYRALGHPAQLLAQAAGPAPTLPATKVPAPAELPNAANPLPQPTPVGTFRRN